MWSGTTSILLVTMRPAVAIFLPYCCASTRLSRLFSIPPPSHPLCLWRIPINVYRTVCSTSSVEVYEFVLLTIDDIGKIVGVGVGGISSITVAFSTVIGHRYVRKTCLTILAIQPAIRISQRTNTMTRCVDDDQMVAITQKALRRYYVPPYTCTFRCLSCGTMASIGHYDM